MKKYVVGMAVLAAAVLFPPVYAYATFVPPSDLSPGDQYRVVFVTSTIRHGTDSDIAVYNQFVTDAAEGTGSVIKDLSDDWRAIASVQGTNARNNTLTVPGSGDMPIYNVSGQRIVDSYSDLWDGSIDTAITYDEFGDVFSGGSASPFDTVWTGTTSAGFTETQWHLGTNSSNVAVMGHSGRTDSYWVSNHGGIPLMSFHSLGLYGISSPITFSPSGIVPEPATLLVWSLLAGLGVGLGWRRRK